MERGGAAQQGEKADTKGQGDRAQGQGRDQGQARDNQRNQGQARDQDKGRDQNQARDNKGGDNKAGDNKSAEKSGGGGKSLSAEQKTKIRTTVIKSGPRVTNVNFSLNVGTVVPRTVTFAPVPTVIVDIYPEYRGYRYFIVEGERIVIIDDSFKIVTILVV
jgi:hypothetical protein